MSTGKPNIIGIDYSYTTPAICVLGDTYRNSKFFYRCAVLRHTAPRLNYVGTHYNNREFEHDIVRYIHFAHWAIETIRPYMTQGTKVFLEGYAMGARGGRVFSIAENCAVLKMGLLSEFNCHPMLIPPTSAKKHFSGRGNAKKEDMLTALKRTEGIDVLADFGMTSIIAPAHDIVDSYGIALTGQNILKNSTAVK